MARNRKKIPTICAYCGELKSDWTNDEPVPKCLFAPPRDNLIKVPACKKCNNDEKSVDDSFLRDMLALNDAVMSHPDGPFIREGFFRSTKKGTSELFRSLKKKYGEMTFDPEAGMSFPNKFPIEVSRERVRRVLTWIARGLYYFDHRTILSKDYRYGWKFVSEADAKEREIRIASLGIKPTWSVGRGQFRYFHVWYDDPNITYWQMVFYEVIFFNVSSVPLGVPSLEAYESELAARSG